ncbi:Ger(x)C family spore germination protein [Crassaminicella thermophila]|uniref:Ger(X)C family spore germination protein n=1 Tax=Crassaminicella thermophila TaxID=2599308 RepID=A0A5C0S8W4_CRATE|nr:Ger(x)C family spore germination protein [Crassaminicella thermophila]QEK10973.1 Ger(x)C family spore germination protein [Crassaminicella thermophila]
MIRKCSKLLILCIFLLILTSCWDYEDIDKKCINVSVGVDVVDDKIEFSGEIAQLTPSAESQEKSQVAGVYTVLAYGKTFEEARTNYDSLNPFSTFLGATRVVVFGQNYAKQGIKPYLYRINYIYDYRKTILPVVCREGPKELFKVKIERDIAVGFLIEDILNHLASSGRAIYPTVGELISYVEAGSGCYVIPYIGIEKNEIKYLGLAVMKESKLIGVINLKETYGILYILAEKPRIIEVIDYNKNKISFRTVVKKRKIQTNYKNEKVSIKIDIDLKAEMRYQYVQKPVTDKDIKELEKILSEKVKNDVMKAIQKAQNEFECDYFQFEKYFKAKYPKIYKKMKWEEIFPKADIAVMVKTKIVNKSLADPNAKKKY